MARASLRSSAGSPPAADLAQHLLSHAPRLLGRHPAETANDDIPIERLSAALASAVVDEEGLDAGGLYPERQTQSAYHPRQPRVLSLGFIASMERGWTRTACSARPAYRKNLSSPG